MWSLYHTAKIGRDVQRQLTWDFLPSAHKSCGAWSEWPSRRVLIFTNIFGFRRMEASQEPSMQDIFCIYIPGPRCNPFLEGQFFWPYGLVFTPICSVSWNTTYGSCLDSLQVDNQGVETSYSWSNEIFKNIKEKSEMAWILCITTGDHTDWEQHCCGREKNWVEE